MPRERRRRRREEANDIVQYLLPLLTTVGIRVAQCKVDTTMSRTQGLRGDVWISRVPETNREFEENIVGLLEAKHRACSIGDIDWRDAMAQGKRKAMAQGINFYGVTNCGTTHRYYNRCTEEELTLDGRIVTQLQPIAILEKMRAQVTATNSNVVDRAIPMGGSVSEREFRTSLQRLANVYRSCGLKKGDERIDPTVAFVILKHIGEKEAMQRTLGSAVKLWDEYGTPSGNFKADFVSSPRDILSGEHGDTYVDFRELVTFPSRLRNEHYKQIHQELSRYNFHGCNFDVFGAVYEEFASQTKKKEFGEFYTRRHITGLVARLLLHNEIAPRELKVGDPACGSGGFLTEAYKTLRDNYSRAGRLSTSVKRRLTSETFWGYDNDEKSVARTKLNMFLVGDGHTHIYHIHDSLVGWQPTSGWDAEEFDYILANPPIGQYDGDAPSSDFNFTNERRYELLFLEKIIKATKPGQDIAIVTPDGSLEAVSREGFRKKVLDACDLHAVLSLPRFAFAPYTKEKTYVLFLRRKQQEEVGTRQIFPIWHYIVDYDGFANSDKRFKTMYHNDLPELEDLFDGALLLAQKYSTNMHEFITQRARYERIANSREINEGIVGKKCGFVPMESVNADNFHNLLSEFHLRGEEVRRPVEEDETDLPHLVEFIADNADKIKFFSSSNLTAHRTRSDLEGPISKFVNIKGGNQGLTEEFIYHNQPHSEDDAIRVFSSATIDRTSMGVVSKQATLKGRKLKVFGGPCLLIARNGRAGAMRFIPKGRFTINDHAYVLTPKDEYKAAIDLRWFMHEYQRLFLELPSSKSGNATFNKGHCERQTVTLPQRCEQDRIAAILHDIDKVRLKADAFRANLERLL